MNLAMEFNEGNFERPPTTNSSVQNICYDSTSTSSNYFANNSQWANNSECNNRVNQTQSWSRENCAPRPFVNCSTALPVLCSGVAPIRMNTPTFRTDVHSFTTSGSSNFHPTSTSAVSTTRFPTPAQVSQMYNDTFSSVRPLLADVSEQVSPFRNDISTVISHIRAQNPAHFSSYQAVCSQPLTHQFHVHSLNNNTNKSNSSLFCSSTGKQNQCTQTENVPSHTEGTINIHNSTVTNLYGRHSALPLPNENCHKETQKIPQNENLCYDGIPNNHSVGKGVQMLQKHTTNSANATKFYKCGVLLCDKKFLRSKGLCRHAKMHGDTMIYECAQCSFQFPEPRELSRHIREHSCEKKPDRCEDCGRQFLQAMSLFLHGHSNFSDKLFKCGACGKQFIQAQNLCKHIKSPEDLSLGPLFKCGECHEQFSEVKELSKHTNVHTTEEKPHKCLKCGLQFAEAVSLDVHYKMHFAVKPFGCIPCGKKFSNSKGLRKHSKIHEREGNKEHEITDPNHKCEKCRKIFLDARDMVLNCGLHPPELPYGCSLCGKKFPRTGALVRHCNSHSGERPFQCTQCMKKFTRADHVVRHLKTHGFVKGKENDSNSSINFSNLIAKTCDFRQNSSNLPYQHISLDHDNEIQNCSSQTSAAQALVASMIENASATFNQTSEKFSRVTSPDSQDLNNSDMRLMNDVEAVLNTLCDEVSIILEDAVPLSSRIRHNFPLRPSMSSSFDGTVAGNLSSYEEQGKSTNNQNAISQNIINSHSVCYDVNRPNDSKDERQYRKVSKPYECGYCGIQFAYTPDLVQHIRRHEINHQSGPDFFSFKQFNKNVYTNLDKEILAAGGDGYGSIPYKERNFECPVCGKRFLNNGHLVRHERCHTGERPYECSQCSKRFSRCDKLLRHSRIHSGVKQHCCEFCNKAFARHDHLINHTRTHWRQACKHHK